MRSTALLCEYVHPNYGSNALVSTGRLASGQLNPPPEYHRQTAHQFLRYCELAMLYLKRQGIQHAGAVLRLQPLLDLCFVPNASISNAFAKKSAVPKGDGTAKDSAYYFPKARTKQEANQLSCEFLTQRGDVIEKVSVGAIGGDSIHDVFTTDKGTVWFS